MEIASILELSNMAREQQKGAALKREILSLVLAHTDQTFLGILGPRGVGKTVVLKQAHAASEKSVYISLDTLDRESDLFELVKVLSLQYKFEKFFLDEVHFIDSINRDLKKIFDFLKVKVFFTSSVSLKLIESAHDLSRRVKIVKLEPFSFREYLRFNSLPCPPLLSFEELLKHNFSSDHAAALPYFKQYLSGGNFPFSLQVFDVIGALKNNLEKIIQADIPRLKSITVDELDLISKAFKFIARSAVSDMNANVLANNLKITRYKAAQYLSLLEDSFILRQVQPVGTNVLKEPKVLLRIPYRLLELDYEDAIGGLREDFAVDCLLAAGLNFGYLKSKAGRKTPDYMIETDQGRVVIEIGGKGKGRSQFKGIDKKFSQIIFKDDTEISADKLPLAFLGFLS